MTDNPPKPKSGLVVTLDIDRVNAKGAGIATYAGYDVSVRGCVPGDRVAARLQKVWNRRRKAVGRLVNLESSEAERIKASCIHFGICGGCLWQDLPYERQIQLKESIVLDSLQPGEQVMVAETLKSPDIYAYRNKMEFSFGVGEGGWVEVGLHPAGQFGHIFDLQMCSLMPESTSAIVAEIRSFANENNLSAYDLRSHTGLLRFLTIREATGTGEVMVIITTSDAPFSSAEQLAQLLNEKFPAIRSIIHTINSEKAQVAYGAESFTLMGSGTIKEKVGGYSFEVSPTSFFQPNVKQAERLFERVVELCELTGKSRVLDTYCGTGGISLHLSKGAANVLGVEMSEDAIRDAASNSARNGIENTSFISGPAEDLLGQLCRQNETFDIAVTDPPRAGMHHKATRGLIDLAPNRIVYVSCNPVTMATDLATLEAHGYVMNYLQVVDMLPQTPHCEVVVRLERQK